MGGRSIHGAILAFLLLAAPPPGLAEQAGTRDGTAQAADGSEDPSPDAHTLLAAGAFQDADRSHRGAGMAQLLSTPSGDVELRFTDFEVTPGPDLEVWLIEGEVPLTSADVLDGGWLSLGPLQAATGDQTYVLPPGARAESFAAVAIWCEDFSVLFAVAPLR